MIVFVLVAITACRYGNELVPARPPALRVRMRDLDEGLTRVRAAHLPASPIMGVPATDGTRSISFNELSSWCAQGTCPVDDPQVTWRIEESRRVPDIGRIVHSTTAAVLAGAFVGATTSASRVVARPVRRSASGSVTVCSGSA